MTPGERWVLHVINYRVEALKANRPEINIPGRPDLGPQYVAVTERNNLAVAIGAIGTAVREIETSLSSEIADDDQ